MVNKLKTIPELLKGGGETGKLIRSADWKSILPESLSDWPQNLSFSLSLLLNSKTPMFLFWGNDYILFYNDAYISALQESNLHPYALGKKAKQVWGDSWKFIEPDLNKLVQGEVESISGDALRQAANSSNDIHLTYQLNPVRDNSGKTEGVLVICNETISIAAREQLQTQKRLEQLNREITHLFNSINEGFYSKDIIANQYINLSAGCPKIYGYTIPEFFANPALWAEVIHPDDKDRVLKDDIELQNGRQTLTEYRIFHKDGSIRWIEVKAIPLLKDGILTRVDGIVNDITSRKLAELETRKQKELSESIINSLPGIFYFYDENGKFLKWNTNFELVSGYSSAEVANMKPLDFFPAEEKQILKNKIEEVFLVGESEIEASFLTKDGRSIPYYFTGRTIVYEGRICLLGTGLDISKRVEIEETLEKSEAMLSYILDSIPQAIFWKDTESNFMGCNKVFAEDAGLTKTSDIIGRSDFDLPWKKEESLKYREDDKEVLSKNEPKIHLVEIQHQADGRKVWIDTTKIPLSDSTGKVYGLLGIYEDISERKKAEEDRERMTLDLIEKNINLKQFSYIVSHNLRSPINKVIGLASLLKIRPAAEDSNLRLIEYIVNEINNLDNVVKDLTTIISFQDLGVSVKEDIIISEEVGLIKESLDTEITEANASITCDFKEADHLKSVKGYFYSILYNLITNAIKYRSPERALKVCIKSEIKDNFICISVADNGLGIDLNQHKNEIFTLYSRFHSSDIPGKGMGLNLVKTQAETLGGKVELESELNKGTTFKVYFLLD